MLFSIIPMPHVHGLFRLYYFRCTLKITTILFNFVFSSLRNPELSLLPYKVPQVLGAKGQFKASWSNFKSSDSYQCYWNIKTFQKIINCYDLHILDLYSEDVGTTLLTQITVSIFTYIPGTLNLSTSLCTNAAFTKTKEQRGRLTSTPKCH